ncbi:MAG TPA: RNA methyltransferase [Dermatophilaceae bacterium]|nr:RNA methyltransferase [Dermatophilaceae bacterium]
MRALARRSAREERGLFLAEGPQVVREALTWCPDSIVELYVDPSASHRVGESLAAARSAGVAIREVDARVLARISDTRTPQGVLAVCRRLERSPEDVLAGRPRLLVLLAHVRDPGNAGTVVRAADAAGADAVLVSDASVDVYNPKAVRASAGSLFHLPIVLGLPVSQLLDRLRAAGVRTIAADGRAESSVHDLDLSVPHAWIIGNEAWGLPEEVRAACDAAARVPLYGRAESLNVAMAATVCLYASASAQRRSDLDGG